MQQVLPDSMTTPSHASDEKRATRHEQRRPEAIESAEAGPNRPMMPAHESPETAMRAHDTLR